MTPKVIAKRIAAFHSNNPGYIPGTLRAMRQDMFISQRELAAVAGLSRETIIRIEAGTVRPYGPTVEKLARATGVDPVVMNRIAGRSDIR